MRRTIAQIMDFLFGANCPDGCGLRIYPKDRPSHAEDCWKANR